MNGLFATAIGRCLLFAALSLSLLGLFGRIAVANEEQSATPSPNVAPAAAPDTATQPATQIDEAPQPLIEKRPRTERESDHLEALSLFSAGRIEEQNEHLHEALRLYQRALRHEPDALPILRQIVPLAFSLDRPNEAVRYAIKAAQLDPSDPLLLRQLGLHLAEAGRFEQALELYEQARARLADKPRSGAYLMLLIELGRLCYLTDHPQKAAGAFAEAMAAFDRPDEYDLNETQRKAFDGDDAVRNLTLFAEAFLAADRADDAMTAYDRLEKLRSDKPRHAYHRARVSLAKKDAAAALDQLQVYFDAQATSAGEGPYALLVETLVALDRKDEAVDRLAKLADAEPKNVPLRRVLARAALDAQQFDLAEKVYRKLLDDEPSEDVYEGLIKLYRRTEQYSELVNILGECISSGEAFLVMEEQVGEIAQDNKVVDLLAAAGRQRLKEQGDRFEYGARTALALLAMEAKRFELAAEFYELALKLKRDDAPRLYETWGVGLLVAEQYAEAARVFQRALDENVLPEGDRSFHHYLAGALEMAGRTDDALAVIRGALAQPDPPPRLYSRLAWVLYHARRYDEADAAYRDFLKRFDGQYQSEDLRSMLRDARLVLSNIAVIRGNTPQAEEWLEQVLDEYPENISALNDLGYLWAEQGKNLDRALRMIQQAVEAEPDNAAYRDSLGWAYFQLGRYREAVDELKKAADSDDPDGVILDHLGDAYHKLGDAEAARDAWRRAVDAFGREEDEEKAAATRRKLEAPAADADEKPPPQS